MILLAILATLGVLALVFGEWGFNRFEHWWFESKKPRAERLPYTWSCPDCRWSNSPQDKDLPVARTKPPVSS